MLQLTKVPNQLIDNIKLCWSNLNKEKSNNNSDIVKFRQCTNVFCQYHVLNEKFYNELTKYFEVFGKPLQEYYVMEPTHIASPHIDRGRNFAINFPVCIPSNSTDAFFGNKDDLNYYTVDPKRQYTWKIQNDVDINQPFFALYEREKFISHDFSTNYPVMFNPAIPHGGYNKSKELRVLFSVSFGPKLKYNEGKNIVKELNWV